MSGWSSWSFEYPEVFVLVAFYLLCRRFCAVQERPFIFVHLGHMEAVRGGAWGWLAELVAVVFLSAALASPVAVKSYDPRNRLGFDIVLALDASGSMRAFGFDDTNGSMTRMEVVKATAARFIEERRQDNIGLVTFGDYAYVAAPLSYEKDLLIDMLGDVETGIAGENTAIGDGLAQALRLLKSSKASTRIIILLTDGQNNRGMGDPLSVARWVAEEKVKLYTIGIGPKEEIDAATLSRMAALTGGIFYPAQNRADLEGVYEAIDALERSVIKSRDYRLKEYYFQYPLTLALLLWLVPLGRGLWGRV